MPRRDLLAVADQLSAQGDPFALVSVMEATDSPLPLGAVLLVPKQGTPVGDILHPKLHARLVEAAQEALAQAKPQLLQLHPLSQVDPQLPGQATVFVNVVQPKRTLLLFGAGHVAHPTAKLAHLLGFRVIVVDERPDYANPQRFPEAARFLTAPVDQALQQVTIDPSTYIIIVTHDHDLDEEILYRVAQSPAAYIGMIGSDGKALITLRNLRKREIPREALQRVRTPMGLDINADTPEEIAVSILAEIIQLRRGGSGEPLSIAQRPLY